MNSASIDDLFAESLLGDYDSDAPWGAVHALQGIGSRDVLDHAVEWCHSEEPLKRARGADVLAQLGKTAENPKNTYPEESFSAISRLISLETDPLPLSSGIHALGHIQNPLAVPLVAQHLNHADPEIRFAVAFALGQFSYDLVAVEALLALTRDVDEDVRDWATFGIGALGKLDSPEVREALVTRLTDSFEDVRQEAMAGLARLKDRRVLSTLLKALEEPTVADITIDAASEMLEIQDDWLDGKAKDYAAKLRERYGL